MELDTSIRFSITTNNNTVYFATAFDDGYIIRSSMPMQMLSVD